MNGEGEVSVQNPESKGQSVGGRDQPEKGNAGGGHRHCLDAAGAPV